MASTQVMPRTHKHKADGHDKDNQALEMEFTKEKETLEKTQVEMNIE